MDPTEFQQYASMPLGSLVTRSPEEEEPYLDKYLDAPKGLSQMLFSRNTGAFLRGLVKDFQMPLERTPEVAFQVLRVGVGEVPLAKLAETLAAELKIPNDKAQGMAKEIEAELFAPVMRELNEFLEKHNGQNTKTKGNTTLKNDQGPMTNDQPSPKS